MKKLIDLANNVVDANQILAMGIYNYIGNEPTNRIKITFKTRKEYVYDPNIEQFTLENFDDIVYVDFQSFEAAQQHLFEWKEELEFVLNKK